MLYPYDRYITQHGDVIQAPQQCTGKTILGNFCCAISNVKKDRLKKASKN